MKIRCTIVLEQGRRNYSAYAPDYPGCVAAAATKNETLELMTKALEMHIKDMRERGEPLPPTNDL